ncbi:hypothetical protein BXZ70DRAFT_527374 [Cristinia sonorae]|uniref:Uncharacterized protein n=1 Tax=Cristinia sonorae TaxID=1940300 RepID=A0A8K0XTJ9_9AGAR|nr:hypothetical protein BXZ70DRAFT_527374 [Cristinia sonorae]
MRMFGTHAHRDRVSACPIEVYAEQLSSAGHGYPLWDPNPSPDCLDDDEIIEVTIGDVGYIRDGSFKRMFNVFAPSTDRINRYGVPEDFVPLTINGKRPVIERKDSYLPPGPVVSQSVRVMSGPNSSSDTTNSPYWFQTKGQAAVLLLTDSAHRETVNHHIAITKYMRQNYEKWQKYAGDLGLDVRDTEILLVRGCVKTKCWTTVTWCDRGNIRDIEHDLSGDGLVAFGELKVLFRADETGAPMKKSGPYDVDSSKMEPNQCVFLNYYKMKRRRFFLGGKKIEAHAGYDDLPDPGPERGSSSVCVDYASSVCARVSHIQSRHSS